MLPCKIGKQAFRPKDSQFTWKKECNCCSIEDNNRSQPDKLPLQTDGIGDADCQGTIELWE